MSNNDQEFLVQKIRTQYTEKQHTELDELKVLDAKVKRPANTFAHTPQFPTSAFSSRPLPVPSCVQWSGVDVPLSA